MAAGLTSITPVTDLNELAGTRVALGPKEEVSQVVLLEIEKGRGLAHVNPWDQKSEQE